MSFGASRSNRLRAPLGAARLVHAALPADVQPHLEAAGVHALDPRDGRHRSSRALYAALGKCCIGAVPWGSGALRRNLCEAPMGRSRTTAVICECHARHAATPGRAAIRVCRPRSYSASSVGNSKRQTGHSLLFFNQSRTQSSPRAAARRRARQVGNSSFAAWGSEQRLTSVRCLWRGNSRGRGEVRPLTGKVGELVAALRPAARPLHGPPGNRATRPPPAARPPACPVGRNRPACRPAAVRTSGHRPPPGRLAGRLREPSQSTDRAQA